MTDLTARLGELVRAQQAREAELEELGERALADRDTTELEARLGVDASVARAAFAPLSEQAQARLTAAIQSSLPAPGAGTAQPRPGLVRRLGSVRWLGLALPAAAVIALALWPSSLPLLGPYELEVSGAVALERAAPQAAAPLGLVPGSALVLLLRPEAKPDRDVTARVVLRSSAEELSVAAGVERLDSGTLKLQVTLPSSLPAAGELVVLVGVATLLEDPTSAARLVTSEAPSGPGWQRVLRPFARQAAQP